MSLNKWIKRRTFSGNILEQEVYTVSAHVKNHSKADKYLRFKNEKERLRHKLGISMRKFVRMVNETCDPSFLYITLTFDDKHEVHTFAEARRIRNLYYRRLQYAYPNAVLISVMGRGENTNRIHFHLLCQGVPEEVITGQWIYGSIVSCEKLREHNYYNGKDHGRDYTGLAIYLFNHWTEEQGGHRWKATRNVRTPKSEKETVAKIEYSEDRPPKAPLGYVLVDIQKTSYGYINFKYVRDVVFDESDTGQLSLKGWKRPKAKVHHTIAT